MSKRAIINFFCLLTFLVLFSCSSDNGNVSVAYESRLISTPGADLNNYTVADVNDQGTVVAYKAGGIAGSMVEISESGDVFTSPEIFSAANIGPNLDNQGYWLGAILNREINCSDGSPCPEQYSNGHLIMGSSVYQAPPLEIILSRNVNGDMLGQYGENVVVKLANGKEVILSPSLAELLRYPGEFSVLLDDRSIILFGGVQDRTGTGPGRVSWNGDSYAQHAIPFSTLAADPDLTRIGGYSRSGRYFALYNEYASKQVVFDLQESMTFSIPEGFSCFSGLIPTLSDDGAFLCTIAMESDTPQSSFVYYVPGPGESPIPFSSLFNNPKQELMPLNLPSISRNGTMASIENINGVARVVLYRPHKILLH